MFRRKEDSLFDNATDSNQTGSVESATVIASPAATHTTQAQSAASTYGNAASQSQAAQRPSTPAANSFRPSAAAPITGDLTRNRMPEAKPAAASVMSAAPAMPDKSGKATRRVLTVGNDILLKGEIATCDRLVIEGKVDATLNDVHTVEIAENGSFKGSANIEDAEIRGLFEGDLVVRNRLVIYASGKVRGKITYGEVEIERGGELSGEIKTSTAQSQGSAAPRPPRQNVKQDDKVAA